MNAEYYVQIDQVVPGMDPPLDPVVFGPYTYVESLESARNSHRYGGPGRIGLSTSARIWRVYNGDARIVGIWRWVTSYDGTRRWRRARI